MAPAKTLHVAVFLPSPAPATFASPLGFQMLDTACVDVFAVHGKGYLAPLVSLLPPGTPYEQAPDITISYVGGGGAGEEHFTLTTGLRARLTHRVGDEAVAPGRVDVVLVPGPDPREEWDPEALAWLKAQADTPGTDIISICTGIFVCGAAGLLQGKTACGPRTMQAGLAQRFKAQDVTWVGDELRWFRDGNFWSSGGVTNGNDAVAAYCRESGRFVPELVEICLASVEVGDRSQRYDGGKVV